MEKFRERLGGMVRNGRSAEEMMEQDIEKIRKAGARGLDGRM